jgi:hypothetical protein
LTTLAAVALGAISAGTLTAAWAETTAPPASSRELFEWLKAGSYRDWAHERHPHPAPGAHPGGVRAHLNAALETSLKRDDKVHPAGAAAVLELYGKAGALHGWAVGIKTQDDSADGKGWYWYEVLSVRDGNRTLAADRGVPACVECHAQGRDFVMTAYPLE